MVAKELLALGAACVLAVSTAHAGDAGAGKANSDGCAQCHGDSGQEEPAIAGMDEAQFIAEMKAYRAGERKHKKMTKAVVGLSDAEIANLAAYYASLK